MLSYLAVLESRRDAQYARESSLTFDHVEDLLRQKAFVALHTIRQPTDSTFKEKSNRQSGRFGVFATGYDFLSLAMCAAADDIGVDTNIVQHGGQSENNAIFGRWTMLPKYGYEMLPDSYRCWDVVSSETINNWATLTTKHSAQTDGHRWIDLVSNNSSLNNDPHGVEQRASKYSLNIIVTLQPSAPQLIDLVVKVINSAPERVAWWVRVHPRQKSGVVKSELSTRIAEGKTILLDLASNAAYPSCSNIWIYI